MPTISSKKSPAINRMVPKTGADGTICYMVSTRVILSQSDPLADGSIAYVVDDWSDHGDEWTMNILDLPGMDPEIWARLEGTIAGDWFMYGRKILEDRASQIDVGTDKFASYAKTLAHFMTGSWKAPKAPRYTLDSILVAAILEFRPGTKRDQIEQSLKTDQVATADFLTSYPTLAPIYGRLTTEAARPTAKLDFGDLMG
jgi:hypothetical protein